MSNNKGLFITFEGGEAVGKSTQVNAIYKDLKSQGIPVIKTREPGGTPLAEAIRKIFKDDNINFSQQSAVNLNFIAREDHVDKVINPALNKGFVVLCDRFTDSTRVYQGNLTSKNDPKIKQLIEKRDKELGISPDKTFLFSSSLKKVEYRMNNNADRGARDKFERSYKQKYPTITQGYEEIKQKEPNRIKEISTDKLEQSPQIGQDITKNISQEIKKLYTAKQTMRNIIKENKNNFKFKGEFAPKLNNNQGRKR